MRKLKKIGTTIAVAFYTFMLPVVVLSVIAGAWNWVNTCLTHENPDGFEWLCMVTICLICAAVGTIWYCFEVDN